MDNSLNDLMKIIVLFIKLLISIKIIRISILVKLIIVIYINSQNSPPIISNRRQLRDDFQLFLRVRESFSKTWN